MVEAEVMADSMGQVGGQDVRLEDVDVDGDPDCLAGADGADSGNRGSAIFKRLSTVKQKKYAVC